MAKVDSPDPLYLNPAAYADLNAETKKARNKRQVEKSRKSRFISVFDAARETEAAESFREFPVSDETVDMLTEEVRAAGDELRKRPFPDEILRYKQAVRNFMHYVVENAYMVDEAEGLPNYLRPAYRGGRGTPEAQNRVPYTRVQVIDKKLEDLAAEILTGQTDQLKLAARLEEITGLLIDLLR
jgi:uncharacterized protein YaaR (DUF327 family)